MKSQTEKAFDFAADTVKQLITLATGIIALTITFSKDFLGDTEEGRGLLMWSWGLYLISIIFGIVTMLALTGILGRRKDDSIYSPNVRLLAGGQIVSFLVATGLIVLFGIRAV
jgi:hypothetical protein